MKRKQRRRMRKAIKRIRRASLQLDVLAGGLLLRWWRDADADALPPEQGPLRMCSVMIDRAVGELENALEQRLPGTEEL